MNKQKISIHEVARLAGVSKSTVSRVISDKGGSVSPETLERVQKAIEQLGYRRNIVAAGLRTQKTYMVLVMIPDVANPFWSEIARAVQDTLEPEGVFGGHREHVLERRTGIALLRARPDGPLRWGYSQ